MDPATPPLGGGWWVLLQDSQTTQPSKLNVVLRLAMAKRHTGDHKSGLSTGLGLGNLARVQFRLSGCGFQSIQVRVWHSKN